MLGGARPDEIRWRGETKDPPECVSVRQSLRRRQYFIVLEEHLGGWFQLGRKRMEIEAFFFHHVKYV